jgi:hypothetical protein
MNTSILIRSSLTIAAVALLAGCGGSQPPIGAPGAMTAQRDAHGTKTFGYTGAEQNFKIPDGVRQLIIVALVRAARTAR